MALTTNWHLLSVPGGRRRQQILRTLRDTAACGYCAADGGERHARHRARRACSTPHGRRVVDLKCRIWRAPRSSGALPRAVRADRDRNPDVPRAVDSAVKALRQSTARLLVKPVSRSSLITTIERAGERWQRRRAEEAAPPIAPGGGIDAAAGARARAAPAEDGEHRTPRVSSRMT